MDRAYLQWLSLIPDVDRALASRIAERFPDLERLKSAYFSELTAIPGVDDRIARRILELVRGLGRETPAEEPSLFLCPECGSFIARGATECDFCGVQFEGVESAGPAEVAVPPVESVLLGAQGAVPLCSRCGAFLSSGRACSICGAQYDDAEFRNLPVWAPLPPIEGLSTCATCGAYLEPASSGCAICGTAVAVAAPEPHAARGVGRDFLNRWRRVSAVEPEPTPLTPAEPEAERPRPEPEVAPATEIGPPAEPETSVPREPVSEPEGFVAEDAESSEARIDSEAPPAHETSEPPQPAEAAVSEGAIQLGTGRAPTLRAIAEIERAMAKVDVLLRTDPTLRAAWETRGDLLVRLGRAADAEASYRRALALELGPPAAWRGATAGLRTTSPVPTPPPGGAGRTGRTNGRVNGRVNGRTNGRTNGRVNGRGTGRINGLANGRVNGRVNGLTDRTGAVNGGRTAPAAFGGVLGGVGRTNGLINGNGFTNGRRGFPSVPRRSRTDRARSFAGVAAVVLLMFIVPVLASLFTAQPASGIVIDGNFGDWARVLEHRDSPSDAAGNADINLLAYKVAADASDLAVYAKVSGALFTGAGTGSDSVFVLVDSDANPQTGYALGAFGADELVDVYGWDGALRGATAYRFAAADRNDWRGFTSVGPVDARQAGGELELRYASANPRSARVLVAVEDGLRNLDRADTVVQADRVSLGIDQTWVAPDVVSGTSTALIVDLTPNGGIARVNSLDVSVRGTVPDRDLSLRLYRDSGNGLLDATDALLATLAPAARTAAFALDLTLASPTRLFVQASVAPAANGTTFGIAVSAVATNATPSWNRETLSLSYVGVAPGTIAVDGAFGDWRGVARGTDAIGDVVNRTGAAGFQNDDIDLSSMGSTSDGVTASFFLAVAGRMLGGDDIPNVRARTPAVTPDADGDRDTVPDRVEFNLSNPNLRFDFNNDNISDAAQSCDVDHDRVRDYGRPGGADLWLNTTIPSWYPAPYAGRAVSVYVGPIAPETLVPLDAAYVYLDADNDSGTGLRVYVGPTVYGIDDAIAVTGRGGLIASSGLYRYNASSAVPFTYLRNATAETDATRLEVQVGAPSLGANYRAIYYMADWTGSSDVGVPSPPARVSGLRILSIAGDQPVFNEVSPRPNPEWAELANPTAGSIALAGWRVQRQRGGGGWTTIYTFPSGSTIGPWGSGSEYLAVTFAGGSLPNGGARIRLVNGVGTIIDQTTYPSVAAGRSWARFKDPTTGKPMDSDNDAADFYTSPVPSRSAPNDRHRPTIAVAKTLSATTAAPGDVLTYSIYYNNTNTGRANTVWVNDTLPAAVTFLSSSVPPSSVVGSTYRWIFTNVAPSSTNLLTVRVQVNLVPDRTPLANRATAAYTDQLNRAMAGSQAWANATVLRPVIVVAKVASVANARPGDLVTYTIYYNNTGSASGYNVVVADTLPLNVTFQSSSVPPASVSGRTYLFNLGTVAVGPHSFTITVRIDASALGPTLVNWAFLNYTTAGGYRLEPSSDDAIIGIPEFADFAPVAVLATIGLAFGRRRAFGGGKTRGSSDGNKGVADSVPDIGGR